MSETGALAALECDRLPQACGEAIVGIPAAGLLDLPARVCSIDPKTRQVRVEFGALASSQMRRLVEYIFCRPDAWPERRVSEDASLLHFIRSTFRLYPFAETR